MGFTDILTLASSIYDLTKASRYARTGMYNAMQATLLYNTEVEKKIIETTQKVISEIMPSDQQSDTSATTLFQLENAVTVDDVSHI